MTTRYDDIIQRHCRRLDPVPTSEPPVLRRLEGIRAVLFDVYGTLLISGSGDVGTAVIGGQAAAFTAALAAVGFRLQCNAKQGLAILVDTIHGQQEESRRRGVDYPEVDILEVWRHTLAGLRGRGWISRDMGEVDLKELAIQYESRANPVWPMPHCLQSLQALHTGGMALGLVSNAQFFTPKLFPVLLGAELTDLGFRERLQFYSYCFGQAKPGLFLYRRAQETLAEEGISAHQVLYVGNDMLNDITPAAQVGFWTGLFAGDQRSLRLRADDERIRGVAADLVLTDLAQLPSCL